MDNNKFMSTDKGKKKKCKFAIFSAIQRFIYNEPSELEKLLLIYLKGDGYKKLAEEQGKAMQEHNYRLKEVERKKMIQVRYDYLNYRIEKGLKMSDEQMDEFEYVKFLCAHRE